jgi:hypothetical protein
VCMHINTSRYTNQHGACSLNVSSSIQSVSLSLCQPWSPHCHPQQPSCRRPSYWLSASDYSRPPSSASQALSASSSCTQTQRV